jgi:hypothetical protein
MSVQKKTPLTTEDLNAMHEPFDEATEEELKKHVAEKDLPGTRWLMRKAEARIKAKRRKRDH